MPRTRYIKPDFFTDEDIANLSLESRLVFIGLWCHADRDGRMEDRPKFFKVVLAPFDDFDIEQILQDLSTGKKPFILRYEVNGKRYIKIINFKKHQRPHSTEKPSFFPEPKKEITQALALNNASVTQALALDNTRSVIPGLNSNNGDGDGDGDGNGDGKGGVYKNKPENNNLRKDKDTAAPPAPARNPGEPPPPAPAAPLPAGHLPEADILSLAECYSELQGMRFVNERAKQVYLKDRSMFYGAKDLLILNNGDVERSKACLKDFSEFYLAKDFTDWTWAAVIEDFPKWDERRREWENGQTKLEKPAAK